MMRAFALSIETLGAAFLAAPFFVAGMAPARAQPPVLAFPVDCTLNETCFIQNYVDADPSDKAADFVCGHLSYDGHKGTVIALPTEADATAAPIMVLAAASGRVTALRDGVPDSWGADPSFPPGQDCGNGVVIDHGNGWETQYCHLREGSLAVTRGESVEAGTPLGAIGKSGRTEFPHLHIALRHDGRVIDPFEPEPDASCGAPPELQAWDTPIAYRPAGLLGAGFSPGLPDYDAVKHGTAHDPGLDAEGGALVLWVHVFGTRPGDEIRLMIDGPGGRFHEGRAAFDRPQARAMRASGRRLTPANTVPGAYTGTAILIRDGVELGRATASTTLVE